MSKTPTGRITRSNSTSQESQLAEIKKLIEAGNAEVLKALQDQMAQINYNVATLVTKFEKLEEKYEDLEARVTKLSEDQKNLASFTRQASDPENIIQESQERWKRRKYVIVSGLQEQSSGSLRDRLEKDKEMIESLANELGVDDLEPVNMTRIGRVDPSKPRLLRFKCSSQETKRDLLRNSKKLKNCPRFQKVFVNPDLTAIQRRKDADLKAELKFRRDAGEQVTIRRGRVVNVSHDSHFR